MNNINSNFFVGLLNYYINKAENLHSKALEASIFANKGDIGTAREDILFDFLEAHIPTRCKTIKGGFVFDSMGNKSRQIDLMVCNDQTYQFRQSEHKKTKSFNCVEGCFAIISVKSYLNKESLIDSLENLASVSTIKKIRVNPFITNAKELVRQLPQKIIFAYGGDNIDAINKNLESYYSTHIVDERSPDLIIVNNEYYFSRSGVLGIKVDNGKNVPYGEYVSIDKSKSKSKYVGATALLLLISRILVVSTFSPHMEIDFKAYGDKIDNTIAELHKRGI
jgi:hypothetical protein